jgi:hypothetical protein
LVWNQTAGTLLVAWFLASSEDSLGASRSFRIVHLILLGAIWAIPSPAQTSESLSRIAFRLASNTAVTGYEQAMVDTLLRLLPEGNRDRAGNARFQLGAGSPKQLLVCPLDEPGYVVGSIRSDGYLTLRRAPGQVATLFDQQLEGQLDLRDVLSLTAMIQAAAEGW